MDGQKSVVYRYFRSLPITTNEKPGSSSVTSEFLMTNEHSHAVVSRFGRERLIVAVFPSYLATRSATGGIIKKSNLFIYACHAGNGTVGALSSQPAIVSSFHEIRDSLARSGTPKPFLGAIIDGTHFVNDGRTPTNYQEDRCVPPVGIT